MATRRKTLRRMRPVSRKYVRLLDEMESVVRRARNLTEEIARMEGDSAALWLRARAEERVELLSVNDLRKLVPGAAAPGSEAFLGDRED